MIDLKTGLTAAATLAIAGGIGFAMQGGSSTQTLQAFGAGVSPGTQISETDDMAIDFERVELTSAQIAAPTTNMSADPGINRLAYATPLPPAPSPERRPQVACNMAADTTALPGALIDVRIVAPCQENQAFTVHHSGLMFSAMTDKDGHAHFKVPALASSAVVVASFADGSGLATTTEVADLSAFERVVLQWRGFGGFELHAREFGAGYGDTGHVWSGTETDLDSLMSGERGAIMSLGDWTGQLPLYAEVYTFLRDDAGRSGLIELSVETEVTETNCARTAEAEVIEKTSLGLQVRDLSLSLPACDAVGSFLVLNNVISDVRIAAR